ncbi:hypothetical protein ABFS82_12G034400 [Erythranthe guttata]
MVLSNKKLKQKLRAAKAELIVTSEAGNKADKIPEGLKTTVPNPIARKPKLSKREILIQEANGEIIEKEEMIEDANEKEENVEVETKMKKRKRDESEALVEKKPKQLKKKKKTKKKKKAKKNVGDGKVNEEGVDQNGRSGAITEQIVAKKVETIVRKPVEISSSRIYVGGIPYYSTEDDIRSFFEGCGTITSIDCMTFPDTGKFRGIAMITFKTEEASKRALALDGSDMGGLFLKVQPFKSASRVNKSSNFSPSVTAGYNRIYIGNLSWDVTEDDLKKLFTDCTISSIRFGQDKESGEFKGYAHVDFSDSLSLNIALKLDQTILHGRPVRISCAVPKKANSTSSEKPVSKNDQIDPVVVTVVPADENQDNNNNNNNNNTSSGAHSKIQGRSCYECGEYGHLSLSCPNKKPDLSSSWPKRKQTDEDFTNLEANNEMSSKIRRRSCYECGEKGHLSSACPNINNNKKADLSLSVPEKKQAYDYTEQAYYENPVTSTDASALSAKIRRRSCYECGEKGHLSSACPKILSASLPEKQADVSSSGWPKKQADDYSASAGAVDETGGVSSKIRRRSCYECGEKGHLSSACPKILSASLPEKQADVASSGWPKKQADDYPASAGAVDDTGGVSSKIRRRSCYECGEKGHLSSACPKILSASLPEKQADVAPSYWPEKQADVAPSYRPEKQADDYSANSGAANGSAVSSKIRRRSCYECGEKGHLSSACPKMQQS